MSKFKQWLCESIYIDVSRDNVPTSIMHLFVDMAEIPPPDDSFNYGWSDMARKNVWLKKGVSFKQFRDLYGRGPEAFTPDDARLRQQGAAHSMDPRSKRPTPENRPMVGQPAGHGRVAPPVRTPAAPAEPEASYVCAFAVKDGQPTNEKIVLKNMNNGTWEIIRAGGQHETLPAAELRLHAKAYRPEGDGTAPKMVATPGEWVVEQEPEPEKQTESEPQKFIISKAGQKIPEDAVIPENLISEEQRAIRDKFEKVMTTNEQSHIMIDALAGSGKTSMLRHLAWMYGKPGQKWLYLVFNNRNKVEAETEFPEWVEVKTTNSFLGTLLETEENLLNIPLTQRIIALAQKKRKQAPGQGRPQQRGARGKDAKSLEKARIIADGPQFSKVMQDSGIPSGTVDLSYESDAVNTVVNYICLQSLQVRFKNEVVKLAGLAKSFALDPRNQEQYRAGIQNILNKYDIDTGMMGTKEMVLKRYKDNPRFLEIIKRCLMNILGYDFFQKDYREELLYATEWMMEKTLPMGTDEMWEREMKDEDGNPVIDPRTGKPQTERFHLGQYRDFNDDIWFAAVHSNDIKWPHYDVVMADEVQDFNEGQKIMLQKLQQAGAKVIAVGDPNQSIYRFRGADEQAFQSIGNMLGQTSQDPNVLHRITYNFRSRQAIIDFANERTHVKDLKRGKTFKDGGTGAVSDQEQKYDDVFSQLGEEAAKNKGFVIKQTAFIARTNQPLVHAALRLLTSGVPFVIVGKDIAEDLIEHIYKILKNVKIEDQNTGKKRNLQVTDPCSILSYELQSFADSEQKFHGSQATKTAYLSDLRETTDAILAAMESFQSETGRPQMEAYGSRRFGGGRYYDDDNGNGYGNGGAAAPQQGPTISQFLAWLNKKLGMNSVEIEEGSEEEIRKQLQLYKKKMQENSVILTTSHKSKGLEFSRVYILRDDLFPHPKAKREEDKKQEENARYVAYTRAKDELNIVALDGQPGYKPPQQREPEGPSFRV
jgi:superfamily I DNA/RNA helicase